ncbi:ATP-dependent RecD-like DNA helicase [Atopobacter sp. AH10]|uniref:SF1B family DNA helicase RecD2 n=1 Tax=Atopobacter sp. AH10 TaxID=2315861 RepID=UPI000EF1C165|nr:ATP-dependent RecD-like DNA helicase [Atopobacter sp. AH10]RLK62986.1 ATP-dependent RecD-like DNA helicase [Atopobacter sp. AH10]
MIAFTGMVKGLFFESPDSLYKVAIVERTEDEDIEGLPDDEVVITGYFGTLHQETAYRFSGELVTHPKYGLQFRVEDYALTEQIGAAGLVAYLSGEQFKGIGKKTAEAIVESLQGESLEILFKNPERLEGIPSFSKKKQAKFLEDLKIALGTDYTLIELSQIGFRPSEAQSLWRHYKEDAVPLAKENPYQLIYHIDGMTFAIVDRVAQQLDIMPDDERRLIGGWFEVTQAICYQSGHTLLPLDGVRQQVIRLLEKLQAFLIKEEDVNEALDTAVRQGVLVVEHGQITIPNLYYAEIGIFNHLEKIKKAPPCLDEKGKEAMRQSLLSVQEEIGIHYDDKQVSTILEALSHPFFLITGGPGTGKTTLIKGIVEAYAHYRGIELPSKNSMDYKECPIRLAAPTGRAAKRMQEAVGMPASTIHRMLGLTGQENQKDPMDGASEDIKADLLIIDEMSMVDVWLMNQVLKALPKGCQVILLGDQDQLPSVGPGQVFHNLLSYNVIRKERLTHIYRQKGQSTIVNLAHHIKDGVCPDDLFMKTSDHSFIPCRMDQVASVVAQTAALVKKRGYDLGDLQVLAPMYRTSAGIEALNQALQKELNPKTGKYQEVTIYKQNYRVGDKVIYLVNDPERNVYNGDIGKITGIVNGKYTESKQEEMILQFDQIEVNLTKADFKNIQLAYCCSIHKAQGSEFKVVILPLVGAFHRMLQRHLIYTGLTRAKEKLILIGEPDAFKEAIHTLAKDRQTLLAHLISLEWDPRDLGHSNLVIDDEEATGTEEKSSVDEKVVEGQEKKNTFLKVADEGKEKTSTSLKVADEGKEKTSTSLKVANEGKGKTSTSLKGKREQRQEAYTLQDRGKKNSTQPSPLDGETILTSELDKGKSHSKSSVVTGDGFVVEEESTGDQGNNLGTLTDAIVDAQIIDPMIGMGGISLSQFVEIDR